jgi:hypothetical protein
MMDSKQCADNSRLCPLQALHNGFSTARPVRSSFQKELLISVYLTQCFKHWHFDNHFHLAVFGVIFVNVLTAVIAILR